MRQSGTRREFLRQAASGAVWLASVAVLAACGGSAAPAPPAAVSSSAATSQAAAATSAATSTAPASTAAATATASTSAAPSSSASARPANGKTTVVWMHTFNAAQTPRLNSILIPDVQQQLSQINLQITPEKGGYTNVQILIAGGSQPDVYRNNGLNPLGMFEDPTSYIARDKFDLSPYNPALLDFYRWDGVLWAVPDSLGGNGPLFAYNRTRFQDAGVAEPPDKWDDPSWTWDELIKRSVQLTKKQGDATTYGYGPMWDFSAQPRPWSTQWIKLDLKTITADTPEMQQAFTVWQDMYCKYGVLPKPGDKPGYNTSDDTILAAASAIKPIGAWNYAQYVADPQADWALAPVPKGTVTAPDQTYFGMSIVKGTKVADAAWTFIKWLATTPDYTLVRQVPPALPTLYPRWLSTVFGDQSNQTRRRAHLIADGITFAQPSDGIDYHPKQKQMMDSVITPLMNKLSACQITPADMLRQAQGQLTAIANS